MKTEISSLIALLDQNGINYDVDFEQNILKFSEIFLETAKTLNLTAIKEPHEVMIKHYFDSIYPMSLGLIKQGSKIIDIGCGGGFPEDHRCHGGRMRQSAADSRSEGSTLRRSRGGTKVKV